MKHLIRLFLVLMVLTGCTINTSDKGNGPVVSKGKNIYHSISELKAKKLDGTDPWLKKSKTLYTIDDNSYPLKIEKIEVGEYVIFINYAATDKNFRFTLEQQKFPDIQAAYKDTVSRMENSYELLWDETPLTLGHGKEASLVAMPLDDYLISLVLPENISDEEILTILKSIKSEPL